MTERIRSRHGNVIAADFRPRPAPALTFDLTTETLFCDGRITLVRSTATLGGKAVAVTHVLGDLATGHVTTL